MNELKRISLALGIAQSELRKVQEQQQECQKYATFLDSITPLDWVAEQDARHQALWQVRHHHITCRCCIMRDE